MHYSWGLSKNYSPHNTQGERREREIHDENSNEFL